MAFGRFFLPGPTEVRPEILAALAQPVIGHRGAGMTALLREADPRLRALFGTERPVYVSTSSATGMMEASVRGGVRRHALCLVNGAFSARYRDLVRDCGRQAGEYAVAWGEAHDPAEVERRLRAGDHDAVTVVHSETSTGVLNPLPQIGAAVRAAERATGREILLLVDGVTSVGGMVVAPEEWGVDCLLTGSQKAMALPPGLAFATASERLLQRAATLPGRGHYLDLVEFDRHWREHQTPHTPAVHLVFALARQLADVEAETVSGRAARHHALRERCCAWAEERGARWGLSLFAPGGFRSPTVTTLALPAQWRGPELVAALKQRGYTVGAGYGRLKDTTIRIGHMGDHTLAGLDALLATFEEVLDR